MIGRVVVLAMTLLLTPLIAAAAPSFVEEAQFGASGPTIPLAWHDWEGDGDPDLAVGNIGSTISGQNFLYLNGGDGSFAEFTAFGRNQTFAVAWADYDNDGDPDMAVGNGGDQQNRLILNNNGTRAGRNRFGTNQTIAVAWADYDLDGDLDLAVGNGILGTPQQNYLYVNNGDGTFTEQAQFGLRQTCSLVWGDYDNDGDPDVAVGNGGFGTIDQNFLYVNNGDGTFTGLAEFGTGDTSCLVWGDSDNDGDLDLAVANWNAGQSRLYINNGDGSFNGLDRFGVRDPNTFAWGDADNDGDLDLAVGNGDFGSAGQNYLYDNQGASAFIENEAFGLGSTDAVAWADYDLDGDLDLAAGNEHSPNQNYLYVNQENDSDALFLLLKGRFHEAGAGYSNRDGVGAKVTVYETGFLGDPLHRLGHREIESHGGFASGNAIEAHFGLPGQTSVDVRITWPGSDGSNIVQDVMGVPVPGRGTIQEDMDATDAPQLGHASDATWRAFPNPTSGPTTLLLAGAQAGAASVNVYDAAGRLIRRLAAESSLAGQTATAHWDGRDNSGSPVPTGVYFAHEAYHGAPGGRIVVLR